MSSRNPLRRRSSSLPTDIALIASLGDPARADLYFFVINSGGEVTRDDAANGTGSTRRMAAFHLDRLVEEGLLEASYKRLSGRTGPGAGRPNKLYRRSERRLSVSLPAQNYELLARLLAAAIEEINGPAVVDRLEPGARAFGTSIGAAARQTAGAGPSRELTVAALIQELAGHGFEPYMDGDEAIRLRNCPYHDLARENTDLICSMNLALMEGVSDGLALDGLKPALEPQAGACCVAFHLDRAHQGRDVEQPPP